MTTPQRFRVLFICIGNACRSQLAESIARRHAPDIIEPRSAGLRPLGFLPELTTQTLLANNCSIERLSSKPIRLEELQNADLIVNLSGLPLEMAFNGRFTPATPSCEMGENVEEWDIADPYGANASLYQQIFREIEERVQQLAGRLRALKLPTHA